MELLNGPNASINSTLQNNSTCETTNYVSQCNNTLMDRGTLIPVLVRLKSNIVTHSVLTVLGVFIILVNLIIIQAYRTNRKLHNATFLCLASLALADILTGVMVPLSKLILHLTIDQMTPFIQVIAWIMQFFPMLVSRLHLLCIAFERFVATNYPVLHRIHNNARLCKIVLCSVWVFCLLIGLSLLLVYEEGDRGFLPLPFILIILIGMQFLTDVLIFYFYYKVWTSISSQKKRLQTTQATLSEINRNKQNKRICKMIGITLLAFEVRCLYFVNMVFYNIIRSWCRGRRL